MSYFGSFYYGTPSGGAGAGPSGAGAPGRFAAGNRDRDAYEAILARLRAAVAADGTAFALVDFGEAPATARVSAGMLPAAVLTPGRPASRPDRNPKLKVRAVSYALTLIAAGRVAADAYAQLDLLENVARQAVEGRDNGGFCLPDLSVLGSGSYDETTSPAIRLTLPGQFVYVVDSTVGYDVNS